MSTTAVDKPLGGTDSPDPARSVTLRFLAAPTDVASFGGPIHGGRVLEWIDKAGYACAVGWSRSYCVTAYVGDIRVNRPIESGHLVEGTATLVYTGRSSMHLLCSAASADPTEGVFHEACACLTVFVAVDDAGHSRSVPAWLPVTEEDKARAADAAMCIGLHAEIEQAMAEQTYTDDSTATRTVTRFLAVRQPTSTGAARCTVERRCVGSMRPRTCAPRDGVAAHPFRSTQAGCGSTGQSKLGTSSNSKPGCCTPESRRCTFPSTSGRPTPVTWTCTSRLTV